LIATLEGPRGRAEKNFRNWASKLRENLKWLRLLTEPSVTFVSFQSLQALVAMPAVIAPPTCTTRTVDESGSNHAAIAVRKGSFTARKGPITQTSKLPTDLTLTLLAFVKADACLQLTDKLPVSSLASLAAIPEWLSAVGRQASSRFSSDSNAT
jgi:hypothetical protein